MSSSPHYPSSNAFMLKKADTDSIDLWSMDDIWSIISSGTDKLICKKSTIMAKA